MKVNRKVNILLVFFFSSTGATDLSLRQFHTSDDTGRNSRIFDVCPDEDACTERLGFLTKYSVRFLDGDTCRTECTFFPRAYILSGYECGSCQCNAVWQCGDVKTICGTSGSENCLCSSDTENQSFCWINDSCNRQTCTTSADCSGEDRCVPGNCCTDEGTGICLTPCEVTTISFAESGISNEQATEEIRRPGGP
ncbi:hypothetical protein FisN_2Hh500 [Fistulifera solaris]|uniref:Uncharacterized protein n=1 Tax=Fistulifera solaris TaxID=1519565 RepID=A0A1Z5JG80_FISSO|nr:hypothetical protein FisN_2Hh500 [Fistulifera solaris]|eukprot:GAX13015.1 hypothetical protein FisN_2Hh500 [Fistulifera solaris]